LRHDSAPVPPVEGSSRAGATAAHQLHADREVPLTAIPLSTAAHHFNADHEVTLTSALPTTIPYPPPLPDAPPSPLLSRDETARQVLGVLYDLGLSSGQIAHVVEELRVQRHPSQSAGGAFTDVVNDSRPPPYEL
jgi:hypothetical protein